MNCIRNMCPQLFGTGEETEAVHPINKINFVRSEPTLHQIPFDGWEQFHPVVCLIDTDQTQNYRLAKRITKEKLDGEGCLITDRPDIFEDDDNLTILPVSHLPKVVNMISANLQAQSGLSGPFGPLIIDYNSINMKNRDIYEAIHMLVFNGRCMYTSIIIMIENYINLPPATRCNIDYVFLKLSHDMTQIKTTNCNPKPTTAELKYYEHYFGMFPTKAMYLDLYHKHIGEYMVANYKTDSDLVECVRFMGDTDTY